MKAFHPEDDGIRQRDFGRMRKTLKRFLDKYDALRKVCVPPDSALLEAFRDSYKSRHRTSTSLGAEAFTEKFAAALDLAETTLSGMVHGDFALFATHIETIDEVAYITDPHELITILLNPKPRANNKARRIWEDAERNLIVALMALIIELNDPHLQISRDLSAITRYADRRLFNGELKPVWLVAQLDPEDDCRVRGMKPKEREEPHVYVFSDPKTWEAKCRQLYEDEPEYPLYVEENYDCFVVETSEFRYYVRRVPRRKQQDSRLKKLQRRGRLRDSRGWRYVIVGVQARHGGPIRLAARPEAMELLRITRERLWTDPLWEQADTGGRNVSSHPRHWDLKIVGVFVSNDRGDRFAGPAEQIITTLAHHISIKCSRDGDAHEVYEGRRALDGIVADWFGHRPVRWKDKSLRTRLIADWIAALDPIEVWTPRGMVHYKP